MTTTVQTADGRSLELHEGGDPGGLPVIVHHGTPGSGVLYDRWATPGVRLIGYDRAGWIDDENGHLTLLENRVGEVHEWLLSHS